MKAAFGLYEKAVAWVGISDTGQSASHLSELAAILSVIDCQPKSCCRFVETKEVRRTQ